MGCSHAASASISAIITPSCMRECVDIAIVTYAAAHQYILHQGVES